MLIFSLFSSLLQRNSVLIVTVYILSGYPSLIFLLYLFKWYVFASRDTLINIFIMSIIQFSRIYLLLQNLKIIQFLQAQGLWKVKKGFTTRTRTASTAFCPSPVTHSLQVTPPSRSKSCRTKDSNRYWEL